MVQVCPRCHRVNPSGAVYCYHDGAVLNAMTAPVALLARPLVFPSGQTCRSVEDLAGGLAQAWPDARQMFVDGSLVQVLRESGRLDLARAADEAGGNADPDLGLYQFLTRLPAPTGARPRLEVYPRRLILGPYPAGGQHRSSLRVVNRGAGQLQGKAVVAVGEAGTGWLRLDEQSDRREVSIDTEGEQVLSLWIDTRGLPSGQVYGTKLIVVTGGGLAEVPVALEIAAIPFPSPPFRSATTPRKLAELMRAHPREAIAALEAGEVARWFAANGWAYPVPGQPATGLAGVQQLFECLGLARPPQLEPTPGLITLHSKNGEPVRGEVVLRTTSKKHVFAQAESDAPWLRVTNANTGGAQQAVVAFEVNPARLPEGVTEAELHLTANGGTRRRVRVRIEVSRPKSRRPGLAWTRALVVGALTLLLYRVLAILPADVLGRLFASGSPEPGSIAAWLTVPGTEDGFLRRFVLATWWLGGLVGVGVAWKRDGGLLDLLGGFCAGAAAGLALAATVGCLLILGDEVPRRLLGLLAGPDTNLGRVPATVLWLMLACGSWLFLGVLIGLLALLLGPWGLRQLAVLATPIRVLAGWLGAKDLRDRFDFV